MDYPRKQQRFVGIGWERSALERMAVDMVVVGEESFDPTAEESLME